MMHALHYQNITSAFIHMNACMFIILHFHMNIMMHMYTIYIYIYNGGDLIDLSPCVFQLLVLYVIGCVFSI